MTHMDDQVAKHIKAMIQRIRRENTENNEGSSKADTLNQISEPSGEALTVFMI